jgi:peptidoglycan hydrolase-like protein with peptidoglycan-binding domain
LRRRKGISLFLLFLAGWGFFSAGIHAEECPCSPETEILPGTEGPDILALQYFLRSLGFYAGEPSGLYDEPTVAAVKEFQRLHNLRITGKVDSDTWQALGEMSPGDPVAGNPPPGNILILVDIDYLSLTVLVDGKPFKSFPVAIGKPATPTPVGSWRVVDKGRWGGGFGTRWIGLDVPFGRYGIHGTNKPWSIGRMESHGCVRMYNRDVEQVYRWVRQGTRVYITGDPFRGRRRLLKGEKGADVFFLQKRLRQLGFYQYQPDGIFGYGTEQALKKFQQEQGLPATGQVGWAEYKKLRLISEE